jgi:hypothetical protein
MTLILNNDEITQLLPMADCLGQLDAAYRDLGEGNAISRTRSDIYGPIHDNGRYVFKTMDGMVPRFEAAAVRLNSDVIRWGAGPGGIRTKDSAGGKIRRSHPAVQHPQRRTPGDHAGRRNPTPARGLHQCVGSKIHGCT